MSLSVFAAAEDSPQRDALVVEGQTTSFAELADRTRAAVGWLRRRGLDHARLVALDATPTPDTLAMIHALMALGVPALPLHPRLTPGERQVALDDAAPDGVVEHDWHRSADARAHGPDPAPPPDDERTLAVVHTSGSTGRPRGVVLSRRAFAASAAASAANLGWEDHDRWLLRLPVAHVGGLSIVTRCLLARRAVVLAPDAPADAIPAILDRDRVTLASLVPTLLARLLDQAPNQPPPPHLRALLLGGAAASPALLERAAELGWPVLTTYGLTEACSQVTTQDYGTVNRGELGAGRPLPGTDVGIDDDGQILVRGPTLMTGHLTPRGPEAPFLDGGWLPTGDHGRLDDAGNLHVAGRRADRIITGGENVDPVEVEQALEQIPGIAQACVFGVPDPEWGEVVWAAVVAGDAFDPATLADLLRARLAPFKRPRRIVRLEALPTRGAGKVDREAAAREAAAREAVAREESSGEESSGEASSGEASSGEASSGEASSGEASGGEASSGEASARSGE
jgi:o-succinylbenzoate---CoA ligase